MRVIIEDCNPTKRKSGFVKKLSWVLLLTFVFAWCFPDKFNWLVSAVFKSLPLAIREPLENGCRAMADTPNAVTGNTQSLNNVSELKNALQLLLVQAQDWNHYEGLMQLYVRQSDQSKWEMKGKPIKVILGYDGLGWVDPSAYSSIARNEDPKKIDGDKRSPAGIFKLGLAFGNNAQFIDNPRYDYKVVDENDRCVTYNDSKFFNRIVNKSKLSAWESYKSVDLNNSEGLYDLGIVIEKPDNLSNKNSFGCLFIHAGNEKRVGTWGAIEMDIRDLQDIVYWLDRDKNPVIAQLVSRDVKSLLNLEPLPNPPSALAESADIGQ